MQKAAIFDYEGTLVSGYPGLGFVFHLAKNGLFDESAAAGIREIGKRYFNGAISYGDAVSQCLALYGGGFRGKRYSEIADCGGEFASDIELLPGTKELVGLMKTHGYMAVALSGSPAVLIERTGLGLDLIAATDLVVDDDICTGEVKEVVADKGAAVSRMAQEHGLALTESYGFGNGGNDAEWMESVLSPVAINPDDYLRHYASRNDWPIFENPEAALALETEL
jgi:putative phosphoserine phosphatase/1-acylglycerol-3-phosphate O-acyltransferase